MERHSYESDLLAPPKRHKTAAGDGAQHRDNWRAAASQNLRNTSSSSGPSSTGRQQKRNRNENHHQQQHFHNSQQEPSKSNEKSDADDGAAKTAFLAFLLDLLDRKTAGAEVRFFICI